MRPNRPLSADARMRELAPAAAGRRLACFVRPHGSAQTGISGTKLDYLLGPNCCTSWSTDIQHIDPMLRCEKSMRGSSWREPSRYVQRHIAPFEKANIDARRRTALHGGRAPKIRRPVRSSATSDSKRPGIIVTGVR